MSELEAPKERREFDRRDPRHGPLLAVLKERHPALFGRPQNRPLPLAIGIDKKLIASVEGQFTDSEVRRFLKWWCRRTSYVAALASNTQRYGLDGHPAGEVTTSERDGAAGHLKTLRRKGAATHHAGSETAAA